MNLGDYTGEAPGASLDRLMSAYERLQADMQEMQKELITTRALGTCDNGLVHATVGPRGQLVDLVINPQVYRRPDADELADMVLEATNNAVALVGEQVGEILARHVPEEVRATAMKQFDFANFDHRFDADLPEGM